MPTNSQGVYNVSVTLNDKVTEHIELVVKAKEVGGGGYLQC